jgi:hypothetical protein
MGPELARREVMPHHATKADVGTVRKCPACGEAQRIEPLGRQAGLWYLRCLACHSGMCMHVNPLAASVAAEGTVDQRMSLGAGLPEGAGLNHLICRHCSGPLRGWLRTGEGLWVRCDSCHHVSIQRHA